jgi:FAD/FMN-containing dehydrogenase
MSDTRIPSGDVLDRLVAAAAGAGVELVVPGAPGWDEARTPWNLAANLRPAAVALPIDAEQVRLVVAVAAELGLRVAPLSSGHNAAAFGDLADTVLVRIAPDARRRRRPGRAFGPGRGRSPVV